MELTGYDITLEPTGLHKITLDCIGNENDLVTIRDVYYNPGFYQVIGLSSRPCKKELDRAKEEMKAYILGTNNRNIFKSVLRAENSVYGLTSAKFASHGKENKNMVPYIKKVIFNDPATIVFWADGTKTVAKAHGDDKFDKEVGLTVCIAKKALGNRSNFDKVFKKWIKED